MVKISAPIDEALVQPLSDYFCETTGCAWGVEEDAKTRATVLFGYFDDAEKAQTEYAALKKVFPALPEAAALENIDDRDWQNEYKKYLKPWKYGTLNWVPEWMRGTFEEKKGETTLYFDAGLAFGTGDHPTTRLCAIAMLDFMSSHKNVLDTVKVVDAGCGSGILALTAKKLGFKNVYGFDRDEEAVKVSFQNAAANGIECGPADFEHAGIEKAFENARKADLLMANIISDVLCIYAQNLCDAVSDGGTLVLSGILAAENESVKKFFKRVLKDRVRDCRSNVMGEWSSIVFDLV